VSEASLAEADVRHEDNDDVTVVVACFNYGAFLEEAVASVLRQEDGAPRVIVVDDGSTEASTAAALERLPEEVVVLRQRNQGVCAARNAGIARATTPYVLVLDADDRLADGALRALRAALEQEPSLGFSYGHSRFFGNWEGVLRFPPYDPYRLLYRHIVGLSALTRRQLFEDTGGFDPTFEHYEDWELWVNALGHGWQGVQVDAVTLEYRQHGRSKIADDRRRYRFAFERMRQKHATLYEDHSVRGNTELGPLRRAAYRFFWGWRPLPAWLERRLHALHWRRRA